ncbi:hypothetical protein ABGT15_13900 [Flavobacterium enshiense]|uniref:hypothetical protein n=1 Tax=Flavobacterium enshiense TaxID=1341165 RepID=UPI00345C7349
MKKLLFGFVVLLGMSVNAKEGNEEYIRSEFAKSTISFVESVRPAYSKGITFETFKSKILTDEKGLTVQGNNLLKSAYGFLQNGASQEEILGKGNVKPMMEAFLFVKDFNDKNKSDKGDLVLFGMTSGDDTNLKVAYRDCRWYQVFCHLANFWDWLVDNVDEIIMVYDTYCKIFPC